MTVAEPTKPTRISDARYERELRELEAERDAQVAAWERDVAADRRRLSKEAFLETRHSGLLRLIEITGHFWMAREEAYFHCILRNRKLAYPKGGRPPSEFRWFRTVRGDRALTGRPRLDSDGPTVMARAVFIFRTAERDGRKMPQREAVARALAEGMAQGTPAERTFRARFRSRVYFGTADSRSFVAEVRRFNPVRFDRIARALSRALKADPG